MEKGFRLARCHECKTKIRFSVSEAQYGKTLVIRCPKCGAVGRVTIPFPPSPEQEGLLDETSSQDVSWGDAVANFFLDLLKRKMPKDN